jgi:hypothetical protein
MYLGLSSAKPITLIMILFKKALINLVLTLVPVLARVSYLLPILSHPRTDASFSFWDQGTFQKRHSREE